MAIAAVTQAFSNYAQKTTGGSSSASSSRSSTGASAQQEAGETLATTKQEAAKGDRQAKVKLAKIEARQAENAPASEPGKGETVDTKA